MEMGISQRDTNKYSSEMETRKQIEEILLNDYGCFDDFTVDKLLDLFGVMHRSFQGTNAYAIERLINDTYQVVDRVDGMVYHQGTKRDCEVYLNGA